MSKMVANMAAWSSSNLTFVKILKIPPPNKNWITVESPKLEK